MGQRGRKEEKKGKKAFNKQVSRFTSQEETIEASKTILLDYLRLCMCMAMEYRKGHQIPLNMVDQELQVVVSCSM